jgi:hypothetical protein
MVTVLHNTTVIIADSFSNLNCFFPKAAFTINSLAIPPLFAIIEPIDF